MYGRVSYRILQNPIQIDRITICIDAMEYAWRMPLPVRRVIHLIYLFFFMQTNHFLILLFVSIKPVPCEAVSDRNWGFNSPDAPAEKGPTDSVLIKDKCSFFRSELNIYASHYLMEIVGYKRQDLQASDDNDHVDDNDRRVN